jgi:Putative protein-S-isoprenylcysteine methyltransferase
VIFVIFQFLFLITLAIPWFGLPDFARFWPLTTLSAVMAFAALALFVWSLMHNTARNIGVSPVPPRQHHLVETGPYRFIRHPMYLAALLFGFAALLFYVELWRLILYIGLSVTLHLKADYEERLLVQRYPEYTDYQKRTKRIVPFIL